MSKVLPDGYSIEAPTFFHTYSKESGLPDAYVVHYIVRNENGQNALGTSSSGYEPWHGKNVDAIESAWGAYYDEMANREVKDLEENFHILGLRFTDEEGYNTYYHPSCLTCETDMSNVSPVTIWDEGYTIVSLMCQHCYEPICSFELADTYRLNNEGVPQDHEEAHQWAEDDGEEWDGEFDPDCSICQLHYNSVDADIDEEILEIEG